MNSKISIITITALVLVAIGLIAMPSIDKQQAHVLILKESSAKVKYFVKSMIGKIFRNSGGEECPTCG
jgi:hypothetical protein